jgi:hypothetical protein
MLNFVSIFVMTTTAQSLQIVYKILGFTTPHTPSFDVMDIYSSSSTHLAGDMFSGVVTKVV